MAIPVRRAPLAMDAVTFRKLGHRLVDQLAGFLESFLVSGGNMANFVCFLAARTAKAGWDVRRHGVSEDSGRRLRVYCSGETHTWIQKATDLGGLGTASIRWIATDSKLRMDVSALRRQIEADTGRGRCAISGRGNGGIGQHRCGRSSAGNQCALQGVGIGNIRGRQRISWRVRLLSPGSRSRGRTLQPTQRRSVWRRCRGSWCTAFAQVVRIGSATRAWTDSSVVPGATYRYRVRANNAAGNSPYSNIARAKAR